MADVEVVREHLDGCGREFFGDEDNGGHEVFLRGTFGSRATGGGPDATVRSRGRHDRRVSTRRYALGTT
jgi:hypothetical protein